MSTRVQSRLLDDIVLPESGTSARRPFSYRSRDGRIQTVECTGSGRSLRSEMEKGGYADNLKARTS